MAFATSAAVSLAVTVTGVADTPSVTNATTNEDTQTTSGLVISPNAADGAGNLDDRPGPHRAPNPQARAVGRANVPRPSPSPAGVARKPMGARSERTSSSASVVPSSGESNS